MVLISGATMRGSPVATLSRSGSNQPVNSMELQKQTFYIFSILMYIQINNMNLLAQLSSYQNLMKCLFFMFVCKSMCCSYRCLYIFIDTRSLQTVFVRKALKQRSHELSSTDHTQNTYTLFKIIGILYELCWQVTEDSVQVKYKNSKHE